MPKVPNKVIYNGTTLIDITDTTAEPANVKAGAVFYDKAGVRQVGTAPYSVEAKKSTQKNDKVANRVDYNGSTLIDLTDTTATPDTVELDCVFYDKAGVRQTGKVGDVVYYDTTDNSLRFFGIVQDDYEEKVKSGVASRFRWANTPATWSEGQPDWYSYNQSIKKVVFDNTVEQFKPTSMVAWFTQMTNSKEMINLQYLDTRKVINFDSCFMSYCYNQTTPHTIDLSNFDTSSSTNFTSMFRYFFYSSTVAPTIDISNFDVSNATSLQNMFAGFANSATTSPNIDTSNFDTSNATTAFSMFSGFARSSTSQVILDLSKINTQNLTNVLNMFSNFASSAPSAKLKWSNENATQAVALPSGTFQNSKFLIANSNFKIYVPDHLYDTYKIMTNWAYVYAQGNLEYQSNW